MSEVALICIFIPKLFNDEIKARVKKNLVQSRSLMEMLEDSIKKYHNKVIIAAEVIEELIELSKEIKRMDKEPEKMGCQNMNTLFIRQLQIMAVQEN